MTKKGEKFLIDLVDDTDSDSSDAPKPKSWKLLSKGQVLQNQINEVFDDPYFHEDNSIQNPDCDTFAFGGIDWCGPTPDADELR